MSRPVATKAEKKTTALMRRMGSPDGRWNPLPPEQHLYPVLYPELEMTKSEMIFLAQVQLKTVDRFKGEDFPQERTEQGHDSRGDLTLKHYADDLDWDLSNASKVAASLEEKGFIWRDKRGVIYLSAQGLTPVGEGKAKPPKPASKYKPVPDYIEAHIKGLSENERHEFLQGWYGAEDWSDTALAQAKTVIYEREMQKKAELCRRVGTELKSFGGRPRESDKKPQVVQLTFVMDADGEFVHTSPTGDVQTENGYVASAASLYSSERPYGGENRELVQSPHQQNEPQRSSANDQREQTNSDSQKTELETAVREAVARSRLQQLEGKAADDFTIRTICKHLEYLATPAEVKDVLEILEDKCRDLAQHPAKAKGKNWGWVVGAVKGEVQNRVPDLEALIDDLVKSKSMNGAHAQKAGQR